MLYKIYSWRWFARPMLDSLKDEDLNASAMKTAKKAVMNASKRCAEAFQLGNNDAASGRKKIDIMKAFEQIRELENYPFKELIVQAYDLGYIKGEKK